MSTPPLKADGTPLSPVSGTAGGDGAAIRKAIPELAHLGFDPIEDLMSWDRFGALLHQHHGGIKALLMDQSFTAGIGQPLLGRNALPGRVAPRPGSRLAVRRPRCGASVPAPSSRRWPARSSTRGLVAGRRAVPADLFGEIGDYQGSHQVYDREEPAVPKRCRNNDRARPWPAGARPTSASTARSESHQARGSNRRRATAARGPAHFLRHDRDSSTRTGSGGGGGCWASGR